ncbi:UvrD-helicase domain-containing protein [Robertmurraya kyonggiensis]|uniref:DNA 3'-5' helicase n=1 Tax=Robertmurraya kyonggiensis TaxID=1037680 RepID=A0A4U1D9X0_9BACI|nr:UvrD-helicase domain-containing protein [Robertmurraya kyonggiensis]TKC19321.1 exonuclease V subunit beta [Robertmurraya kyonggiensis]
MTKTIVDQAARDKIKQDLHTNFLVEAGAGSGKTTSLVDRMVNLIYTGTSKIEHIVAITFTRKAADELKVRFQSVLEKTWKEEADEAIRYRLAEALQNIERCFLGTVHAFCAKLLRERPIEAGLDLAFKELEEADDVEILEEAWGIYLQALQETRIDELKSVEDLGISVDELFNCLKELKDYPDVDWVTEIVEKPDLQTAFQSFMNVVKEARRCIPEQEPDKGYDSLQKAIVTALQKVRFINVTMEKDIISILTLFDKRLKPTLNRWESKEDAKFFEEKILTTFEALIKPLLQEWKEYCHPIITNFLLEAVQMYMSLKKERSLLNFQDLLIKASTLLKNNGEVRAYFQEKYRFLLVDEFQDTDPIQAELMFYLTGEDMNEPVWTRCKPKAGSLFVVGDPKQAIYRFRRADIDTYNRVKELIVNHGGEVLQLTMNFRTLDSITNGLNTVFSHYLPETESVYQAAYRPLNSFHEDTGDEWTGIKQLIVPADFSKKEEIIEEDAKNIAVCIRQQIESGKNAKDFMILTRYNDGIGLYAKAVEALGISVSISGEVIIGETREFQELSILLKTFTDPTDQISLVAVLRGIFFGISDNDLYQWKKANGYFSIYADVPEGLPTEVKKKFELSLGKLRSYQKWTRELAPTVAIEKIMDDVGFYPLLLKNNRSKRTYKSLQQILTALRKHEGSGNSTYKQIFERLEELVFEKSVVINIEEDADAVRIMNVHKAKGLEAPIVFLAHPAKVVKPDSFLNKHIKREDSYSKGYFAFSVRNGFQDKELALPVGWESVKEEELAYLTEEEVRILYVAATRAEKTLILSSNAKNNNKNPWNHLFEIENIAEIEIDSRQVESSEAVISISLMDYLNKTEDTLTWLDKRREKSFEHWSPTKDKDYAVIGTIEREEGGGMDWGTVVHEVLEKVVRGIDVSQFIKSLLSKYDFSIEREEEVIEIIRKFQQTEIWDDITKAEMVLSEVPFTRKITREEPLYRWIEEQESETVLIKGIIDLIYKTDDGWVIVDYKTDRPTNKEDFAKLEEFYRTQIGFYQEVWETLTNEKVAQKSLYFVYA